MDEEAAIFEGSFGSVLKTRHRLLKSIREFFNHHGYIEVETPYLMKAVPPDPYVEPLRVSIPDKGLFYLHTSPEMAMKKLLLYREDKIFQICKVFREEEFEEIHSTEFTMLEWYMKGEYRDAMNEVEDLLCYVVDRISKGDKERFKKPWRRYDLEKLFLEKTSLNPFDLDREALFCSMERKGFRGIDGRDDWNSLFFKLFIQEVEPSIKEDGPYFITDWPLSVSTMARRKGLNKVDRFELYINGLEIANGYTELLDADEQMQRFLKDNRTRSTLNKELFPVDEEFLQSLSGLEGPYTGVSVGIDRLLMALGRKATIDEVLPLRVRF
jgi:elongation factor P--(R)-beta-lysine ligase